MTSNSCSSDSKKIPTKHDSNDDITHDVFLVHLILSFYDIMSRVACLSGYKTSRKSDLQSKYNASCYLILMSNDKRYY